MSVVVNLLPDRRQAKVKQSQRRQLAIGLATLVGIICGGTILALFLYSAGQKVAIAALSNSINDRKQQLEKQDGLIDALTAQQHLASLPGLYKNRVLYTKFFEAYQASSPQAVTLSSMTVDEQRTLTVEGTSAKYADVAKLARALEESHVTVGPAAEAGNAPYFSSVEVTTAESRDGRVVEFSLVATVSSEVFNAK